MSQVVWTSFQFESLGISGRAHQKMVFPGLSPSVSTREWDGVSSDWTPQITAHAEDFRGLQTIPPCYEAWYSQQRVHSLGSVPSNCMKPTVLVLGECPYQDGCGVTASLITSFCRNKTSLPIEAWGNGPQAQGVLTEWGNQERECYICRTMCQLGDVLLGLCLQPVVWGHVFPEDSIWKTPYILF